MKQLLILAFLGVLSVAGITLKNGHLPLLGNNTQTASAVLAVQTSTTTSKQTSTTTPTVETSKQTSTPDVNIESLITSKLDSYVKQGKFRGPKGDRGDRGERGQDGKPGQNGSSGISTSYTTPTGVTAPIQNLTVSYTPPGASNPGSIGAITYLSSKEHTTNKLTVSDTANIDKLNVSGASSLSSLLASSILPQSAGSLTSGVVTTEILTANPDGSGGSSIYNDSQKFIAVGEDGFVRFVYFDNNWQDLHLVRCLDTDCTTKNNTVVASNLNYVDSPVIVMGTDGLPRIAYLSYNTPRELRFIRCTNADCTTKTDNLVDVATSIGLDNYYTISLALGSDGFARIVYDNYIFSNASALRMAQCTNIDCSTKNLTTIAESVGSGLGEGNAIQIAPDGFARIVFASSTSATSDDIRFIQCTNASCSTKTETVLATLALNTAYYVDLALGSDGFGRIAYSEYGTSQNFIQCTNASCSTNNITTIDSIVGTADQISIVMGNDDLPRIVYGYYSPRSTYFIQCTNPSCTTKNSKIISSNGAYQNSIILGLDGFARIFYVGANRQTIYLARLANDEGANVISGSSLGGSGNAFGNIFSKRLNTDELYTNELYTDQLYLNGSLFDSSIFSTSTQWLKNGSIVYTNSNVGIGTSTPENKLDVAGSLSAHSYGWGSTLSQFGQPFYKINELTDVLYRADSRFTVTNGSPVYFDGDYGSNGALPANTTTVININVDNQSGVPSGGITYPEGSIYVSFYYDQNQYSSIGLRVKCNGSWYSASAPKNISTNPSFKVMKFINNGCGNFLTDIELSISTDNTHGVWLSEINYLLDRASYETEFPYVSKYNNSNSVFGKFGIATTTPWRSLSVTGTVALDGLTAGAGAGTLCLSANKEVTYSAGATCTVSSARFKHDIATSTTGLDFLNKLRPVTFKYNEDIGVPGEQFGFIAEEVELLDPRLVVHDKDNKPFSVRYENLTATIVKAIQEQQLQIDDIKTKLASTTTATSTVIIHDTSGVLSYLTEKLIDGVLYLKEIVVDKVTATLGVFKRVETEELEAKNVNTEDVNTKKLCLGGTCVTETEFKSLLERNSVAPNIINTESATTNSDTSIITPDTSTTTETNDVPDSLEEINTEPLLTE